MSKAMITTRKENQIWVITMTGDLTSQDTDALSRACPWLRPDNQTTVMMFDMTKLSYINSGGIALLIRSVREARRHGYQSCAYGVSTHYQKIFRIVGLTGYMELFPDEYSAVETVSSRIHAAADETPDS